MAINQQGVGLPYPSTTFPTTVGVPPFPGFNRTNQLSLAPGGCSTIPPGYFMVDPGKFSVVQALDPITNTWKMFGTTDQKAPLFVNSDGFNFRVINPLGCVVGVLLTASGAGYTAGSPPAVTFSSGGAVGSAIVGGAIGTLSVSYVTGTVTSGAGANYTFEPTVSIAAPPVGGIQATAVANLSGTQINPGNPFTLTNQGAGYPAAPAVTIVPHPFDPNLGTIINATAVSTLTGATSVTGVLVTNYGNGNLGGVPLVTIAAPTAGTQATGTAIVALTIMSASVTAAGSNYGAGTFIQTTGGYVAGTAAYTNPATQIETFYPRNVQIPLTLTSGNITAAANPIQDGGIFQTAPTLVVVGSPANNGGIPNVITGAAVTANMGAVNDTVMAVNIGGNG